VKLLITTKAPGLRSTPEIWKHGANCYRNHGCRCVTCKTAHRDYQQARRERIRHAR
jgi:hypothetical protein